MSDTDLRFPKGLEEPRTKLDKAIKKAIERCVNTRTCVVAGDSYGVRSLHLSKIFRQVIVHEPFPANFEMLVDNLRGRDNVVKLQACLGHKERPLEIQRLPASKGDFHEWAVAQGKIPQVKCDNYYQLPIDLVVLSVCGYELMCLQGMRKTMVYAHPVIVYRDSKNWKKLFGKPEDACESELKSSKYEVVKRVDGWVIADQINKPKRPEK